MHFNQDKSRKPFAMFVVLTLTFEPLGQVDTEVEESCTQQVVDRCHHYAARTCYETAVQELPVGCQSCVQPGSADAYKDL